MSELRWNPIRQEWVVTATLRQERTFLPPQDFCPLCPSDSHETEVPSSSYDIVVFENKFPSLSRTPPSPALQGSELFPVEASQGICEVVLYTSEHNTCLGQLAQEKIVNLVRVWKDRYLELGSRQDIAYVFIFENRGEAIGVTIAHPHGQIYAFSFLPPTVALEITSEQEHFEKTQRCLHCDVIAEEEKDRSRLVAENESFLAFVPFYARFPYEVHLYAKKHLASLADFQASDEVLLADCLQTILQKYDNLWGFPLPYIMAMHQKPTMLGEFPGSHFHIEFYPPNRTKDKLKYLAGCESGAGTFINDSLPEEKAAELRATSPCAS